MKSKLPLVKTPKRVSKVKLWQVVIRLIISLILFSALLFFLLSKSAKELCKQGQAVPLNDADFQSLDKEMAELSLRVQKEADTASANPQLRESKNLPEEEPVAAELSLLFAGDVLLHEPIVNQGFAVNPSPDYSWLFKHVKGVAEEADFSFANMEGTLTEKPYAGYPVFRAPGIVAQNLKDAGFDVVYTANNHCLDGGTEGVFSTLRYLREAGLNTVGTRMDKEEKPYLLLEKNGIKLAISSFTYETVRQYDAPCLNTLPIPTALNGLIDSFSIEDGDGVNYGFAVDAAALKERVEEMKSEEPDLLIFIMHWGTEYAKEADLAQEFYGKVLAEAGVHLIVGMHPHVVQPLLKLPANNEQGVIICYYSLGNFVSSQLPDTGNSEGRAEEGALAKVKIKKEGENCYIEKADYLPLFMYKTYPGYPQANCTYGWALPVDLALKNPEKYEAEGILPRLEQALNSTRMVMGEALDFSK